MILSVVHRNLLRQLWVTGSMLIMLCGLLPAPQLNAQAQATAPAVSVEGKLLGRRVAVGQAGTFIIHVANGRPDDVPAEIKADGLTVRLQSEDRQGRITNGVTEVNYYYYYAVIGNDAGAFTIPAVTVKVRGIDHTTQPVELAIYQPRDDDLSLNASKPYFLKLNLLQTEIYEHQMVPIEISVYSRGRGTLREVSQPKLGDSEFVIKPFPRAQTTETIDIDGFEYTRAKIASSAFALRPGDHKLGPVEIDSRIEQSTSSRTRGLRAFFSTTEAVSMASNVIDVKVKPLPEQGKPADFTDTVGSFEITATASPTDVKTGDPISVDVVINGVGNFDNVPVPTFQSGDAKLWRTYEARRNQDPTQTSDGVTSGRVTFTQIVIPQGQVTELPSFTMSYFDPQTGQYQTLRSAPIPITVAKDIPAPSLTNSPALNHAGTGSGTGSYAAHGKPSATLTDILTIKTRKPAWTQQLTGIRERWYFRLAQIVPAAIVLLLVGASATRFARKRLGARRSEALQASYASLRKSLNSDTVRASRAAYYQQVQRCLDAWRREHGEAEARLPMAGSSRLAELEQHIHSTLYSGGAADRNRPPSASEIEQAVGTLDQIASNLR